MTLEEAKEYFVTYRNMMKKLGLSLHAYLFWRSQGYIPYYQQVKMQELSEGKLIANIDDWRKPGGKGKE